MRRFLIGAIALAALGVGSKVEAADIAVKGPAPTYNAPAIVPMYNWTGIYLGGHLGWGWQHTDSDVFDSTGTLERSDSTSKNGFIGGGQIGFNWMFMPSWVVGIEADISGADINGSSSACTATGCGSGHSKLQDFGTVRGRLGYAWDNILIYGTGGWAWSQSKSDRTITCAGSLCPGASDGSALVGMTASASGTQSGWTAGGGVEWGFLPNWTARVEYLHLQFDNVGRDYSYPGFPTAFRHFNSNHGVDVVRVGVNYLFH